ncbi:MAG TPA: hypothetical protein VH540_22890, partial [Ktedonobacterales bacterium]
YPPTQQQYPPTQQGYQQSQPGYQQQQSQPSYPQSQPTNYAQYAGGQAPYGAPAAPGGAGFDFGAFWKNLGQTGQVCLIGGVVLLISLVLPWFSVSVSSAFSSQSQSYNAFAVATNNGSANVNDSSFFFTLVWLVILASIALIALPVLTALGKLNARQGQMYTLIAAGVALVVELAYMIRAFTILSSDQKAALSALGVSASVGPGFGFWLGFLATLAAGGVYLYFNFLKKPAMPGMMGMPLGGQPTYQQPGSQPYGQPMSQPYAQPGSQPYPPQYQQPQQQYPGQYPGQQPPQYPGQ